MFKKICYGIIDIIAAIIVGYCIIYYCRVKLQLTENAVDGLTMLLGVVFICVVTSEIVNFTNGKNKK